MQQARCRLLQQTLNILAHWFSPKIVHRFRYSNLTLAGKILVPTLSIFLGMWAIGTVSVGYFETRKQAEALAQETQKVAFQLSKELSTTQESLSFKAKSIADNGPFIKAVEAKDKQALLSLLLPLKSNLALDFVQVIDSDGDPLSDVRNSVASAVRTENSAIAQRAQSGLHVTSLMVSKELSAPILIKTLSVTSRNDDVGSLLVGYALSTSVFEDMLGLSRQHIVLLQGSEIVSSTLPLDRDFVWSAEAAGLKTPQPIDLEGQPYLAQAVELPHMADDQFSVIALTPLSDFRAAQRQLWLWVIGLGLFGGGLVTVAGLWTTRLITRRITALTEATQRLAGGDLSTRILVEGSDEVATLAGGFNHMAQQLNERDEKIQTQLTELEQLISELQQMPERVHTEKMVGLGQMVAGVAHEINNPISFIYSNVPAARREIEDLLGLLTLYQQHYPNPPDEIEAEADDIDVAFISTDLPRLLDSMQSGARRIREIVLSLRNFSRKDESVRKAVDLHDGLDSTLMMLAHRLKAQPNDPAKHPGIEVVKAYGTLPLVPCFASEVNQAVMNILDNAVDAIETRAVQTTKGPADGETDYLPVIYIKTDVNDDGQVLVRIRDNGTGISETIRDKLFNPFFTTKAIGSGKGIGLSISYQIIVEKHGGKLWCESVLGEFSEFVIQLPSRPQGAVARKKEAVNVA